MAVCDCTWGTRGFQDIYISARTRHPARYTSHMALQSEHPSHLAEDCGDEAVVGRELQRREDHALRVPPPARVVLAGGHDAVRGLGEEQCVVSSE